MSATISYKLKNSVQGALAGGGDPATSPLYVFGPFLALIVGAGVAQVTFGASIWLAVITVIAVSAMYRYVMIWITDGSGGSGLSEEEFGGWAVKTNAAITVIEYTLTFLVSIAALVTFLADRFPALNASLGPIDIRTLIAVLLSVFVALAVNRGPQIASRLFGPATALILAFLWLMIFTVIWKNGLVLPGFNFSAFDRDHIQFTLGGFARILALMTGIEIFANLVASYEGGAPARSRKAFGSMIIVMGTTVLTMIIVGPAILEIADPALKTQSVFTQTMDALLPAWLSYAGTLIGIAVLLSAAAASTQGIQNLSLGLRARHYIPARFGKRNAFDVPAFPSWAQVAVVIAAFVFFGTHEETYLALYAAGVFILLSMTGWSAFKRFFRYARKSGGAENYVGILVTCFSSLCASLATLIIFRERFFEGAWSYLIMVPALYLCFDYYRRRLGAPPEAIDGRLSAIISAMPLNAHANAPRIGIKIERILVPLSTGLHSEVAFHAAMKVAEKFGSSIYPAFIDGGSSKAKDGNEYLNSLCEWADDRIKVLPIYRPGDRRAELIDLTTNGHFDLICMASSKMNAMPNALTKNISYDIVYQTTPPILFFRPDGDWHSRSTRFKKMLIPLDGSALAEQVLPYAVAWARHYGSQVTLLSVPEHQGDPLLTKTLTDYLEAVAAKYFGENPGVEKIVGGSGPARTILKHAVDEKFDIIAMVSHGRGGLARQEFVKLGSVTETVFAECHVPMLFISGTVNTVQMNPRPIGFFGGNRDL